MAVIARESITVYHVLDISSVTWYYKLQASTASPPSKPTTNPPPTGWETTEPTYTEGSTNSLYICELTTFSDGTFDYSDVSLSSSYEAAKVAYNKSVATKQALDNMEIGGTNLWIVRDQVSGYVHTNQKSVVAGSAPNWPICSDYIPVTEGETLVVQQWIPNNTATDPPAAYYGFYPEKSMTNPVMTSRGTFEGASGDTYLSKTIAVPTGAKYLRISLRSFGNPDSKIKIERGNMPTSWSPAPEDVSAEITNAIDDVSVGGRNLLRRTSQPANAGLWRMDKATVTDGILTLTPTTALARAKLKVDYLTYGELKNNTYTFSVDIRELEASDPSYTSNTPTLYIGVQLTSRLDAVFNSAYDKYRGIRISDDNWGADWHRYSITLRIPDDFATTTSDDALVDSSYVSVQIAQSGNTTPIQIRNPKLELGNKSTDWSPAPEDVSAEIANAIGDISVGGRNLLRGAAQEYGSRAYKAYSIPTIDALENDSYILQLWGVTLDAESTGIKPYWGGGTIDMSPTNALMPDENGYICIKWTPTAANLAHAHAQNKYINLYNYPNGHTGYRAKVERWKLEKGDLPTAWSPAPEDGPGDGINLIVNTLAPTVSAAAKYPRLKGQTANTGGRGTATVAEHGIRFTNTTANWQFIRFGNSVVTTLDLLGLEPGEIYTYSGEVDFKVFSGSPASATEYVFGVFIYGHFGSNSSNDLLQCIPIHRYEVTDLTDRGTEFTGVKFAATFALPRNVNKLYIDIRGGTESGGTTASHHATGDYIEIRNVKFEKGSRATDWSPAPEDVEAEINNALTSANGKNKVIHQDTQPTGTGWSIGDTWFDSAHGYKMHVWDGLGWVAEQLDSDAIKAGAIKAGQIDAGAITTDKIHANGLDASVIKTGKIQGANNQLTYFDLDNAELVTQSIDSNFAVYLHDGMTECERDWLFDGDVEVTKYIASRLGDAGLELISPPHLVMENGQPVIDPETGEREMYKYYAGIGIDRIGNEDVEIFYSEMPLVFIGNDYFPGSASVLDDTKAFSINEWHHTAASYGKFGTNVGIEIYGSSNSPYIDFHRSASLDDLNQAVDFNTRLIANADNQLQLEHNDGSKTKFVSGNVQMLATKPALYFHYNKAANATARIEESSSGVLKAYNSISNGSDQALKKDILPIDARYLELIDKLEPKEFRFKDSPEYKHLGFVAQDVDDILDEIGIEDKPLVIPPMDEDDYYALDYQQIIPALVAYCQDLRKEINELKSRLGE